MNSKTTPDENFIFNKCLKYLPDAVLNYIVEIFNASLVSSIIPECWKQSQITMIGKKETTLTSKIIGP